MITALNRINRAVAETRFNLGPRWPEPHAQVDYAQLHVHEKWIDLCWWNGTAWQYITSRLRPL